MYSLTIIGAGQISCGYDNPNSKNILTHIHGALSCDVISFDSIVETNKIQRKKMKDKWGDNLNIFPSLEEAFHFNKSEIVIIATPTITHFDIIKSILDIYIPKIIVVEKPVVSSFDEWKELQNILENKNIKIVINFIRRFDPSINKIRNLLNRKDIKISHFYGTFAKGLLHNGSHMMDLIDMLFGNIQKFNYLEKEVINNDIFGKFYIESSNANGIISNISNDNLSLFEITIYTNQLKIEIRGEEQVIYINEINYSNKFEGFVSYSNEMTLENTLNKSGLNTLEYIVDILENESAYKKVYESQKNVNNFIYKVHKELME